MLFIFNCSHGRKNILICGNTFSHRCSYSYSCSYSYYFSWNHSRKTMVIFKVNEYGFIDSIRNTKGYVQS